MREIGGIGMLYRDLRYAFRALGRGPGFTAVTVLSLALGIGAATAIFSAVYGVLINPYPYAKPNEIWAPFVREAKSGRQSWHAYSYRDLREIQKLPAVAGAMGTTYENVLLTGDRSPEFFNGVRLSGNAFNFLGVDPIAGRTIQPSDVQPGSEPEPVVVLSYLLWQRLFQGDPAALGQRLVLNGLPHTIIGVMPPRFGWYGNDSFWLPLGADPRGERSLMVILRLKRGVAKEAGEQQLQALNLRLAAELPDSFPKNGFRSTLRNYMDMTVASGAMQASLYLLLAMVAFLLLIACANVASLQLARTTSRAREIAIRLSIGAGRRRILQQLLTESVLLAVIGGALGVLFAVAATKAIVALMPRFNLPNEARITLNGHVLLFSLAVSLLTGILFGLAPAIKAARSDLTGTLKDGARGAGLAIGGRRARDILVAVEIALAVILLAGSSLAVRTFLQLQRVDLGYQADRVLLVGLPLPPTRYATLAQRNEFAQRLLERLKNLPGVQAAAIGNGAFTYGGPQSTYAIEGRPQAEQSRVRVGLISADYLR
ncbi:MAG: ABC transporter permease, partial [Bryobacteraceae bacterium]